MPRLLSGSDRTAAAAEAVKSFGYEFELKNGNDFRFQLCTGPRKFWRSQLIVTDEIVQSITFLTDDLYLPKERPFVLETVCRLNDVAAVLGGWTFNWSTGSCQYRFGLDLRGHTDPSEAIRRSLSAVSFPIKLWERCFARRGGGHSAAASINAALIELGANDHGPVSDATRRALFKVVTGAKSPNIRQSQLGSDVERCLNILASELKASEESANRS
ncbi:MAG: hypothetical protein ABI408_08205 [Gemmatimonadaceae bacterium]